VRRALRGARFPAYSVVRLALEMLDCICALHRFGFVHRDIKPGNFLVRPSRRAPLALIDFGCACRYVDAATGAHIPFAEGVGFTGTVRYASLRAHDRAALSRRDDLASWFYCVAEMASGALPWPGRADRDATAALKRGASAAALCEALPEQFAKIYAYIARLEFEQKPDYRWIAKLIQRAIARGVFASNRFDWEALPAAEIARLTPLGMEMGEPGPSMYADGEAVASGGCCC
jgi:serine/threonine protein kinase